MVQMHTATRRIPDLKDPSRMEYDQLDAMLKERSLAEIVTLSPKELQKL